MSSDQVLPLAAPGGAVRVEGDLFGSSPPAVPAGEVVIWPVGPVERAGGRDDARIFAERGDVLAHPAVVGWQPTWRFRRPESVDDVIARQGRWRRATAAFWALVGTLIVFGGAVVWAMVTGSFGGVRVFWGAPAGAATIAQWRRARRACAAFHTAQDLLAVPAQPMHMTIDWTVGHGEGPVAVARLSDEDHTLRVPVFNLPTNVPDELDVLVRYDPHTGMAVIDMQGRLLWPEDRAPYLPIGARRAAVVARRIVDVAT